MTWIILTDVVVENHDWQQMVEQSAKDLVFVAVTASLLYWLLDRHYGIRLRAQRERDEAVTAYTTLFEQHGLPQLLINVENARITAANEAAAKYYGWSQAQLCTMKISDINTLSPAAIALEMAKAQQQKRNHFQFRHRRADGQVRDVEVYSHPVRLNDQNLLYSIVVDVSEQGRSQLALERSNRLLKAFVASIRAIMQHHDKQGIANAVTRSLVEDGQYAMAWLGLVAEHPMEPLIVVSQWGDCDQFLEHATWNSINPSFGPTERAIQSGLPQRSGDLQSDPSYQRWPQATANSRFRSVATLPLLQSGRVFAVLSLYALEPNAFDDQEMDYLAALASDLSRAMITIDSLREYERVDAERLTAVSRSKAALFEAVTVLSGTIELRDPYTAGHQRRVTWLALEIGRELGLSNKQLETLNIASLLHDIGKIAVPAEILSKPGRLNVAEFALIKQHPEVGESLLRKVSFDAPIASIVGQHHERLDGSGYPRGLQGEQILLEARIIAVADVMEAMISHRPYRPGLSLQKAILELRHGSGSKYDGRVVNACIAVMERGGYEFLGVVGEPSASPSPLAHQNSRPDPGPGVRRG